MRHTFFFQMASSLKAVPLLFICGAFSLFGGDLDLVQQQKREAARRKACAASRLVVNDANMHMLFIPGLKYHFTQLVVDPPLPPMHGSASSDTTVSGYTVITESKWACRKRERERMESEIAEAEANIRRWDAQWRTLQMDCTPYVSPDKEGYIKEKSEELQRWIEGEHLFIHVTKKKLDSLN